MARYLHTMLRITDVERSRAFYEAIGMEFRRELPIVRNGEHEATNYFFGFAGQDEELELTWNTALTIANAMKPTKMNTVISTPLAITSMRAPTESPDLRSLSMNASSASTIDAFAAKNGLAST